MSLPLILPAKNVQYNILFGHFYVKVMKEQKKIFKSESIGDQPDTKMMKIYRQVILYLFHLYWLTQDSMTLDYWKEVMEYSTIRECLLTKGIDLDTALQTIIEDGESN